MDITFEILKSYKRGLVSSFLAIILFVIIVVALIRNEKRKRLDPLAFCLWKNTSIASMGKLKVVSDKIIPPDSDKNSVTYTFFMNIFEWDKADGVYQKDIFRHGLSNRNENIIRVLLDAEKNDLIVHVNTRNQCPTQLYKSTAYQLATGRDFVWTIAAKPGKKSNVYKRKVDGSDCWSSLSLSLDHDTLVDMSVVVSGDNSDDAMYVLTYRDDLSKVYRVFESGKKSHVKTVAHLPNERLYELKTVKLNDSTHALYANSERGQYMVKVSTNPGSVKEFERHADSSFALPVETIHDTLLKLDRANNTLYKCSKSNDMYDMYETHDMGGHEFTSLSADDTHIWGLEKSTQKLFSQRHDTDEWVLRSKPTSRTHPITRIETSKHASPHAKLWVLQNGQAVAMSKTERNLPEPHCDGNQERLNHFLESFRIQNVPIGEPFQVAITLAQKRIDLYLNGRLTHTHILKGNRSYETIHKPLVFFESKSKTNALVSNFCYLPYPIHPGVIKMLYSTRIRKMKRILKN